MTGMESTNDEQVRDQLANERPYLAWMRTGLSTMGFGKKRAAERT